MITWWLLLKKVWGEMKREPKAMHGAG